MFGSKNKQQNKQVEAVIETMEGNLKGVKGENKTIEYENIDNEQRSNTVSTGNKTDGQKFNNIPEVKNAPFKSPFNEGNANNTINMSKTITPESMTTDIPKTTGEQNFKDKIVDNNEIKKSFSPEELNNNLNNSLDDNQQSFGNEKKDESSPFLHESIDAVSKNEINTKKELVSKKSGLGSFLLIIVFIILLSGILFGGYYFYMNKDNKSVENIMTQQEDNIKKTKPVALKDNTVENINEKKIEKKEVVEKKDKVIKKNAIIKQFITTEQTFNSDLKIFVTKLKSDAVLQGGVFINPMINSTEKMNSLKLLKALHFDNYFKTGELKDTCKLFAVNDGGAVRIAAVFELEVDADNVAIKERIRQKEKELLDKMKYLFVDGERPVVPVKYSFKASVDNQGARYVNYKEGINTESVDWNIIKIGSGKLIYFATSRKTAKELTDYFMRLSIK